MPSRLLESLPSPDRVAPVMGSACSGLVPQVTIGAMSSAAKLYLRIEFRTFGPIFSVRQ